MSEVRIKGRKEPMQVSYMVGKNLKELFLNEKIPDTKKIEIDDWVGTKGDIKGVWLDSDSFKKMTREVESPSVQMNREYIEGRKKFLALSLDEKANQLGFFGFMYVGFKGTSEIPEKVQKKVIELQRDFFEKNPFRIVADPVIFKELLGGKCIQMASGLITRVVSRDMQCAETEENYQNSFEQH